MAHEDDRSPAFDFHISVADESMAARVGRVALNGRRALETPNFLAITSRGVVPHIAPDVLRQSFSAHSLFMPLEDFIWKASSVPPIMSCPAGSSTPLHTFTCMPSSVMTVLAARRTPAVVPPNGNNANGISIFTATGFQHLSIAEYANYVRQLRPDIAIPIADLPTRREAGPKRAEKMQYRSLAWLEEFMKEIKICRDDGAPLPAVFAPVLPTDAGSQFEYLEFLSDDLAGHISGLAIHSSSILPDLPSKPSISSLVRLSLEVPASPHHILRQVALGMDILTIPFVNAATDAGIALMFQFPQPVDPADLPAPTAGTATLPLGMDLWPPEHAASDRPLLASCGCDACTHHSRAFIRHLLNANEMLSWVLLQIHNHAVMTDFFAAIRASIAAKTFERDCDVFARTYDAELPGQTGQGPRVRGYHAKSEGPGESKKNKPAWGVLGEFD